MSKPSQDLVVWSRNGDRMELAARCGQCSGLGRFVVSAEEYHDCEACSGLGWFGIDANEPVMAHAGSTAKVAMLTVRYACGAPLWHPHDGFDADLRANNNPSDGGDPLRPLTPTEHPSRRESNRRLTRLAP